MHTLGKEILKNSFNFPEELMTEDYSTLPEKVLQFGEGNFLRGFSDWMINEMNKKGLFNGSIVVLQPRGNNMVEKFTSQDNFYTLCTRGIHNGKVLENKEIITSISRIMSPLSQYEEYMKCAENPDLRVILSNTTEAGITYSPDDKLADKPQSSFPGKLTAFLYKRFNFFHGDLSKGFIIIPCELIDNNGEALKNIVLKLSKDWDLGEDFIYWLKKGNFFLNNLVDRIVTGFPKDEFEKLSVNLGYKDYLLDTSELYYFWAIEGSHLLSQELPFTKAGLNVIFTEDLSAYRERKVRILNGAHTITALAAYLAGKDTVGDCIEDEIISKYIQKGIYEEIIPTLDSPMSELEEFASSALERFANPFIKHYLLSISLNSVSKFKSRVLPSIKEYINRTGTLPCVLTFSLAALLAFYRGTDMSGSALIGKRALGNTYEIKDDMAVMEFFMTLWNTYDGTETGAAKLTEDVFSNDDFWGEDLNNIPGLTKAVSEHLYSILTKGAASAIMETSKILVY